MYLHVLLQSAIILVLDMHGFLFSVLCASIGYNFCSAPIKHHMLLEHIKLMCSQSFVTLVYHKGPSSKGLSTRKAGRGHATNPVMHRDDSDL